MKAEERTVNGVAVVDLIGEIDLQSSPKLRELFQAKGKAKCPRLVINFTRVPYIDSSGLATLIEYYQTSRAFKGGLALCCLPPRVKNVFEIARLDQIFAIHADEETALTSLSATA